MNYLNDPVRLQFELSSMCNALCLGCVRTDPATFSQAKDVIPGKQYISFEVFKKILTAPSFASATELEFCGTIDDPLMHPEFLEFLDYARSVKDYRILIHTNASLRSTDYWCRMADVLKKFHKHVVRFSIDGLEDTNHIYRQNTTWSKIMANAKAFIQQGGQASWQFLTFPWNSHQIEAANQLSKQMGFIEFMSRHDRSSVSKIGIDTIKKKKQTAAISSSPTVTSLEDINQSLSSYINDDIVCDTQTRKMFFIGYDARLWPCCFLHNGFITADLGKYELMKQRLFDAYGSSDWNDLNLYTVEQVLAHEFYTNDLTASWQSRSHSAAKSSRIYRCTEVCSSGKLQKKPIGNFKIS
jgi:sulfatase maturation enzyme AslB (radical SAM superfamily)